MSPHGKVTRRQVIRGAGSIAIGLPFLEAFAPRRVAAAPPEFAQRFIAVYQPGGNEQARWLPRGTESDFEMSEILAPLQRVREHVVVLGGVDLACAGGEQHQSGIVGLLTGMRQGSEGRYPAGPSIDQVLARRASMGKPRGSIEMAVRWATGKSHGLLHPINALNFADDGRASPISPRIDPQEIFNTVFGSLDTSAAAAAQRARRQSILDFVGRRYATLAGRLGAADRARLDEHLTRVRELESSLQNDAELGAVACSQPEPVDTSDYNPKSGLRSADDGSIVDGSSDAAIPKVGKFMTDMLVMAMACDLTGVGTLQWSDTEAKHTFPWLSLREHHHYYQHDGGFRSAECAQIGAWYAEQNAYLIEQLQSVDMGGHRLIDETVVFVGSEISHPPSHSKDDMPLLLFGGGGGLRGGRLLKYDSRSHNDLLVAILNLFGDPATTFGDPRFVDSPLTGLT